MPSPRWLVCLKLGHIFINMEIIMTLPLLAREGI